MSNAYDQAHALATALKESNEFSAMKQAQAKVNEEDTSKRMLDDFRQKQMELQMKQMQGQQITEEDQQQFQNLIDTIKLNPTISTMLEAEQRLNVLLEDVMKIVMEPAKEIYEQEQE